MSLLLPILIIKNESENIKNTLLPFIEKGIKHFFILDTGSTDDSVKIVKNIFNEYNLQGLILEEKFIDFSTTRNRAIKLAKNNFNSEFILFLDAEWYINGLDDLLIFCHREIYNDNKYYDINIVNNKHVYPNTRLFKYNADVTFIDPVDEYINVSNIISVPSNVFFRWNPTKVGIEKSKLRWTEDIKKLNSLSVKSPRNIFYLAQKHFLLDNKIQAKYLYIERTTMKGNKEEIYYSYYKLGKITNDIIYFLKAFFFSSFLRAEPLIEIAILLQDCNTKYAYLKKSLIVQEPSGLLVNFYLYKFRYKLLADVCYKLGFYKEAISNINIYISKVSDGKEKDEMNIFLNLINDKINGKVITIPSPIFKDSFEEIISVSPSDINGILPIKNPNTLKSDIEDDLIHVHPISPLCSHENICSYNSNNYISENIRSRDEKERFNNYISENISSKEEKERSNNYISENISSRDGKERSNTYISENILENIRSRNGKERANNYKLENTFEITENIRIGEEKENEGKERIKISEKENEGKEKFKISEKESEAGEKFKEKFSKKERLKGSEKESVVCNENGRVKISENESKEERVKSSEKEREKEEQSDGDKMGEIITIAILAKNKAIFLPLFLKCIENQTWPKKRTNIYIRSNNNTDGSIKILEEWLKNNEKKYNLVYKNYVDVEENIQKYKEREWNNLRFKILGKIRYESVQWALENNSHYFVIDCDNFIKPYTIEKIFNTNCPIVAPFMKCDAKNKEYNKYSNFHSDINETGYYKKTLLYDFIFNQHITGLINVPVVHCGYLIRKEYLKKIRYLDNTNRFEYVIFSEVCRMKNINQYLDNREVYGYISFSNSKEVFDKESWRKEFY